MNGYIVCEVRHLTGRVIGWDVLAPHPDGLQGVYVHHTTKATLAEACEFANNVNGKNSTVGGASDLED